MINFSNVTFIKSAPGLSDAPKMGYPEVLTVGKSNVGKSSLINALCNRKSLAFTSSKPGHTRLLTYYDVDHKFYLVDAPGYGYAKGGLDLDKLFGQMMSDYFAESKNLKLVLLLLDSRRELSENDLEILDYMKEYDINYYIVVTKSDKVNQKEKAKLEKHLRESNVDMSKIYMTSSLDNKTVIKLRSGIEKAL